MRTHPLTLLFHQPKTDTRTARAQELFYQVGPDFEVNVKIPYKNFALYTAELRIAGDVYGEPIFHSQIHKSPIEALESLTLMIESWQPVTELMSPTREWLSMCDRVSPFIN